MFAFTTLMVALSAFPWIARGDGVGGRDSANQGIKAGGWRSTGDGTTEG